MELAAALLLGLVIGVVVGTVGGGGAILALPIMVYVLGEGVSPGTTASLIVVTLGAAAGAGSHARHGHVCWRVAAAFALPAAPAAYLGSVAGGVVDPRALILCFVPVMLAAAALTLARSREEAPEAGGGCPPVRAGRSGGAGLAVGALTGFFGVGGGFLIVPALTNLLGLAMRNAVATSLAIISATGAVALATHLARGADPNWGLTAALCGSAAAGALLGSALGRRLAPAALARAFAAVVAAIAVFLLVDVLVLGGPPSG